MRKPSHLGRTLRNRIADNPIVSLENRELNDEEKEMIAKRKKEQEERLARIAARAKKKA